MPILAQGIIVILRPVWGTLIISIFPKFSKPALRSGYIKELPMAKENAAVVSGMRFADQVAHFLSTLFMVLGMGPMFIVSQGRPCSSMLEDISLNKKTNSREREIIL